MFVNQKAKEISLALVKISVYIRRKELRSKIEDLSLVLLARVAAKDWEAALTTIDVLNMMVDFGKTIYQIEPINAKILLQELNILNSAIRQIAGLNEENGEKVDISGLFSKVPAVFDNQIVEQDNHDTNGVNSNGNGINSTIRQSAILEKIRQSGKVSIKDLIAEFPEVSERTLRYDLQKLCNQAMIERIGSGGPATYYILRNKTSDNSL